MNDIDQVIEEKFTRCPECRSFSVRQSNHLTLKERLKQFFKPVTAHICGNCSYRFVEYGTVSTTLKLWPVAAVVIVVAVTLFLVSGEKESTPKPTPQKNIEEKKEQKAEVKEEVKEEVKKEVKKEVKEEEPEPEEKKTEVPSEALTISGEIVLGNSNRFGVNWRPLGEGVQITRLSNGPLKKAGILMGDILLEVDDKKISGEGINLEQARDDIFYGKRAEVLIKIRRNDAILIFKLVKKSTQ